jgi:hypothetical protein
MVRRVVFEVEYRWKWSSASSYSGVKKSNGVSRFSGVSESSNV